MPKKNPYKNPSIGSSTQTPTYTPVPDYRHQHTQPTSHRNDFTIKYALGGLIIGGGFGLLISAITKFVTIAFTHNYGELDFIFNRMNLADFILTSPAIITEIIFAIVGLLLDGFDSARKKFSITHGTLGFVFGGLIGIVPIFAFFTIASIFSSISDPTGMTISILSIIISAIAGFIWNGMESKRKSISIPLGFLGMLVGGVVGFIGGVIVGFIGGIILIALTLFIFMELIGGVLLPIFIVICTLYGAGFGFLGLGIRSR